MKPFALPEIDLDPDPSKVRSNFQAIHIAREKLKAFTNALEGLAAANAGMCTHPDERKRDHYDPGYAGGGYDYTSCLDCGARVPK